MTTGVPTMSRKLLVLAFGGMLIAAPLAVTPGSLSAEERGEVKIAATALGVPGAPAYGVPGALAYGGAQGPAALGVPGAPAYGVPGALAYGVPGPQPRRPGCPRLRFLGSPDVGRARTAPSASRDTRCGVPGAPAYGVQGARRLWFLGIPDVGRARTRRSTACRSARLRGGGLDPGGHRRRGRLPAERRSRRLAAPGRRSRSCAWSSRPTLP